MQAAWRPQLGPQVDAITATWCHELFFGGARGGGKSDFLLGDYSQDVETYGEHWQGILFRRTCPELEELIRRSHELFPQSGAEWLEGKSKWRWPNGAQLKFRHMEFDRDAEHYRGHQYPWIGFDELDAFPTSGPYQKMRACNRWAAKNIPTKRMRAAGNPGGVGSGWIREMFIDYNVLGYEPWRDPQTGRWTMFIPSKVEDNKILMENDPDYINNLYGVGSPALVRAWLKGDFTAIVGGYFELTEKHFIKPQKWPEHWTRFRAMDWGSAKPFCVLWLTVSDGSLPQFPAGSIIVYREWYGSSSANVGLKMRVQDVAQGVIGRTPPSEVISYTVGDPAMFHEDGGPSIAERMANVGVPISPGDNKRVPGWQQITDRLVGIDGRPMLYIVGAACPHLIRTLSTIQHDPIKAEDCDTKGEDHAPDALRYGCQSRPYTPPRIEAPRPKVLQEMTYDELLPIRRKNRDKARVRI